VTHPAISATPAPPQAALDRRFARRLFELLRIYWVSDDARRGGVLLAGAVALELLTVYANVQIADGQRRVLDALQDRQASLFFERVGLYVLIVVGFLFASTYRVWLRQRLEIRWRRVLTDHFLAQWMDAQAYCQVELRPGDAVDNPDQRVAEDVRNFVASALGLSLTLLSAIVTLVSFAGLLWTLSSAWHVGGERHYLQIPGFMMWVAILYAVIAMAITHRVGRRLVPLHFDRQRFEADFRFGLMRFRENSEAIAFARGEQVERGRAAQRFKGVAQNFLQLIRAQRNLSLTTGAIGELNGAVPLLLAAPGFFMGTLTLGGVAQTRFAYGQVSGALAWFINAYQEIAAWRASIERLLTLSDTIECSRERLARAEGLRLESDGALQLSDVTISRPDGVPLIRGASARVAPGERVAVLGPAGVGKTALFRAMVGMWPFGAGEIAVPRRERTLFLGARPYIPIGSLRAAVSYPAPEGSFPDAEIRRALAALGLEALAERLDESAHWEQVLSSAEEQRLALVRVLLQNPEWVFLDEATSALDENEERQVYETLARELPRAAVVTAVHRSSVIPFHPRRWTLVPADGGAELRTAA
jgi:putative ATP-binding cassette transporter